MSSSPYIVRQLQTLHLCRDFQFGLFLLLGCFSSDDRNAAKDHFIWKKTFAHIASTSWESPLLAIACIKDVAEVGFNGTARCKYGILTLLFCRGLQRIVLKWAQHLHHTYFSLFCQSKPLSLPLTLWILIKAPCWFTEAIISLNVPESGLFADFVKQLANYMCFHR